MKVPPLLVMAMGAVIIGGSLYAAVAFLVTPHMPPAVMAGSPQANDSGGREGAALAALRYDLEQLRAEMRAGRSTDAALARHHTAGDPTNPPHKLADELRRLRAEVDRLRTAVQQTAIITPTPADNREAAAEFPPRPVDAMPARTEVREQHDREYRAALDTYVHAEGVDTQWSVHATGVLTQVLASAELVATAVHDVTCQTTVCRLAVEHENMQDLDQFLLIFPMQASEELPQLMYFHDRGTDGRIHTVVYLIRPGHGLPAPVR